MRKIAFIDELAKKGSAFTFRDATDASDLARNSLRNLLYRLEKGGWIERIERGKYLIIPLGAEAGRYTLNEFVIGSMLVEPACISYWSALHYHGLTEQIPSTVFMQTTSRKKKRDVEVFGVRYRIIRVDKAKLFGVEKIWFNDVQVSITNREKTVVDCLDRPRNCGGIVEVAKAIKNASLDWKKVIMYANALSNTGVVRRLGFLSEYYQKDDIFFPNIDARNYLPLDPSLPSQGKLSSRWRLIINVKEKTLGSLE